MLFGPSGKLTALFRNLFFAFAGIAIYVGIVEGFGMKSQIFGFVGFVCMALTQVSPEAKVEEKKKEEGSGRKVATFVLMPPFAFFGISAYLLVTGRSWPQTLIFNVLGAICLVLGVYCLGVGRKRGEGE